MAQLNAILPVVKKHHFWFMLALAMILGLWAWHSASGTLLSEFDGYRTAIQGKLMSLRGIVQKDPHPNDNVIEGFKQDTTAYSLQVWKVWDELHNRQRREVLRWPKNLTDNFRELVGGLAFGADIPLQFREEYHNQVRERFAEFPAMLRAKLVPLEVEAPKPGAAEETEGVDYLIQWNAENQQQIQAKLDWLATPDSNTIWTAQEYLWVLESLVKIIARTNEDATARHNSKVTGVLALEIGADAVEGNKTKGRIRLLELTEDEQQDELRGPQIPNQPGAVEEPAAGEAAGEPGRYVDAKGMSLAAGEEKSGEFKRIPVRMVLEMRPLEISRLLVECATTALPVEVQQVRINVDIGRKKGDEEGPKAVTAQVIVQGLVYIYNPPDLEKLGLTSDQLPAEAQPPAGQVPARADGGGANP